MSEARERICSFHFLRFFVMHSFGSLDCQLETEILPSRQRLLLYSVDTDHIGKCHADLCIRFGSCSAIGLLHLTLNCATF